MNVDFCKFRGTVKSYVKQNASRHFKDTHSKKYK
jgi:hypothetical protein